MNYLAHAYLSFGIPEIAVGNLLSDFVKGKKKLDYPEPIQKGMTLHRAIDTFTDNHAVTREAKKFFQKDYGLYAGALMDIVYDHYLANDLREFPSSGDLDAFAQSTYKDLEAWTSVFPERFARVFPYMRSQNWLYNYRFKEGIFNSFAGLARRAAYMASAEMACNTFEANYDDLGACYRNFFPALKNFAYATLEELSGNQATGIR